MALAYDVALLKEVLTLQALYSCYNGQWSKAHNFYRQLADLATEINSAEDRKVAYKGLAQCCSEEKDH